MDIREWLHNTADREPPDEHDHPRFAEFFRPQPSAPNDQVRTGRRHKRKRASSDPTDTIQRRARRTQRQVLHSSTSEPRPIVDGASASSRSISRSGRTRDSSVSARDRGPIEPFKRRARHKTRPDRYDPKPKKQRRERESKRQSRVKSKRRRSHRNGDGAHTVGLVQSFQLKHGPKNERLTLRPGLNAGIFKHGRASAPMVAGDSGLPDLVFNEMKFLKRPREHQDELPRTETAKSKKTKKSRKEIRDEEVSAYFKRPAIREPLAEQVSRATDPRESTKRRPSALQEASGNGKVLARDLVDLPADAFLGFGSRGPKPEGAAGHHATNSYYTWSESVLTRPEPDGEGVKGRHGRSSKERLKSHHRGHDNQTDELLSQQQHQQAWYDARHQDRRLQTHGLQSGKDGTTPSRQGSEHLARQRQQQLRGAFESSQPLPRTDINFDTRREGDIGALEERSRYHTSDILKIRHRSVSNNHRSSSMFSLPLAVESEENVDPMSSAPSSDILRNALEAVDRSYNQPPAHPDHGLTPNAADHGVYGPVLEEASPWTDTHLARIAFDPSTYVDKRGQPVFLSSYSRAPHRDLGRTGKSAQSEHQRQLLRMRNTSPAQAAWHPFEVVPEDQHRILNSQHISASARQAEALLRQLASDRIPLPHDRIYEPQFPGEADDADHAPLGVWDMPQRALHSTGEDDEGAQSKAENEAVDAFPAFWKPNKLY